MKQSTSIKTVLCGFLILFFQALIYAQPSFPEPALEDDSGFELIFDGKTLDGWDGDPTYWRVENGTIVGEITPETILERNTFLIWRKGITGDFELKLEYRISKEGNSGINYRSEEVPGIQWVLKGYHVKGKIFLMEADLEVLQDGIRKETNIKLPN